MNRRLHQHQGKGREAPLSLRARLEAEVERLLALLDSIDGDPDLEPSICGGQEWCGDGPHYVEDDCEGGDVNDEGEPNDWDDERET